MDKEYTHIQDLIDLYTDVYYVEDTSFIEVVTAAVVSNKIPGDPLWMMVVGASSSGKSEIINAMLGVDYVHQVSTLTTNTFLSGMSKKGEETSLLKRIGNGVIAMKDFTSIISLPSETKMKVMGDLREVYDGHMTKETGTGDKLEWGPGNKMGLVAGTTDEIYQVEEQFSRMGSRWLNYKMPKQSRKDTTHTSMDHTAKIRAMRQDIQDAFTQFVNHTVQTLEEDRIPDISNELQDNIVDIAEFASRARSPVSRNFKGEMEMVYDPEMPMRMASQLKILAQTFAVMNDYEITDRHEDIIYDVALNCISKQRWTVCDVLAKFDEVSTKALAMYLDFPTRVVRPWVEDLNGLSVVERSDRESAIGGDMWKLYPEYKEILREFGGIERKGEILDTDNMNRNDPYNDPAPGMDNTDAGFYGADGESFVEPDDLEEWDKSNDIEKDAAELQQAAQEYEDEWHENNQNES